MPFGLTNSPATFQRLIDKIITPDMAPHVYAYLDDIIIITETFEDHLKWLKIVIDKLNEAGLTINEEKSFFGRQSVKYLGFVINNNGLQVDPDKIAPIIEYPAPRTLKQVRRFMGLASWYRRFIPNFSDLVAPISSLIKKKVQWQWGEAQQNSFDIVLPILR